MNHDIGVGDELRAESDRLYALEAETLRQLNENTVDLAVVFSESYDDEDDKPVLDMRPLVPKQRNPKDREWYPAESAWMNQDEH